MLHSGENSRVDNSSKGRLLSSMGGDPNYRFQEESFGLRSLIRRRAGYDNIISSLHFTPSTPSVNSPANPAEHESLLTEMTFTTHTPPPAWWSAGRKPFLRPPRVFAANDVISGRAVAVFRKVGW